MSLFDWLNEITYKKSSTDKFTETDWKTFQQFMINRYLSQNLEYIELVNYIQRLQISDNKQIYEIYKELIPKKQQFLKYIGGSKKNINKNEIAPFISKYFECSIRESNSYIDILDKSDIIEILGKMGINEKESKKLLK
jgi:hypothetical protein